jgi:hypothetical protein
LILKPTRCEGFPKKQLRTGQEEALTVNSMAISERLFFERWAGNQIQLLLDITTNNRLIINYLTNDILSKCSTDVRFGTLLVARK